MNQHERTLLHYVLYNLRAAGYSFGIFRGDVFTRISDSMPLHEVLQAMTNDHGLGEIHVARGPEYCGFVAYQLDDDPVITGYSEALTDPVRQALDSALRERLAGGVPG